MIFFRLRGFYWSVQSVFFYRNDQSFISLKTLHGYNYVREENPAKMPRAYKVRGVVLDCVVQKALGPMSCWILLGWA